MIKAIIFDCFGVFTTDRWKEFVGSLSPEQRQPASDLNHALDAGHITQQHFIEEIVALTGRQPQTVQTTLEETADHYENKNFQLLSYISELKPKYKIGMLSNISDNWIRSKFLTVDEQKLFDAFVFSFEVHTTKPDPHIFEIAVDRLGVEPTECVFVDDIDRYCQAAKEVGMQAIVYNDFDQMKKELDQILANT